jgi:hypothetical protein
MLRAAAIGQPGFLDALEYRSAAPFPVRDRDLFLRIVAELLADSDDLGDGEVHHASAVAQGRSLKPPITAHTAPNLFRKIANGKSAPPGCAS